MGEKATAELIALAQGRDARAKEELVSTFRPRIAAMASAICKRTLDWKNDDELSISLMAFCEAVDTYDASRGASFPSHVYTVIHRRLVDYFRQETRYSHLPLEPGEGENPLEVEQAWRNYLAEEERQEREEALNFLEEALGRYGLSLEDLLMASPKHRDTRERLVLAARVLALERPLLNKLLQSRQLPLKELALLTGQSRKILEKGRRYIVAVTLILAEDRLQPLREFISFPNTGGSGQHAKN